MGDLPGTDCPTLFITQFPIALSPDQNLAGGFPPVRPRISENLDRDIKVLNFEIILGSNVMLIRAGIWLLGMIGLTNAASPRGISTESQEFWVGSILGVVSSLKCPV